MKDNTSDNFPCKCRALKKNGEKCNRNASWITQITDRDSWIEALKTGWPCVVKGVKSPTYLGRGLCGTHYKIWSNRDKNIEFKMIGEAFKNPALDTEYEEVVKIGDTKNGGTERKSIVK